jgi:hypothetical protein
MNTPPYATEIIAMAREDLRLRAALAETGALFEGYHPDMERVHTANARRLEDIITDIGGWPAPARVGAEAAEAAWLIVQHAIGLPDFQRKMLPLIQEAAEAGDVPAWQAAYLEDRIRVFEGRLQLYGTQFDWDEAGALSPLPIENPQDVNLRRAAVGLDTIEEKTAAMRRRAESEGETPPQAPAKRRKEAEDWARKAGWRP